MKMERERGGENRANGREKQTKKMIKEREREKDLMIE